MCYTAEVVDPITLGAKLIDVRCKHNSCNCNCCCDDEFDIASIPESVCRVFDDSLCLGGEAKRVFVSLGIFSIIKLERKVQLMIPCYDFCIPQKECVGATAHMLFRPLILLSFVLVCKKICINTQFFALIIIFFRYVF